MKKKFSIRTQVIFLLIIFVLLMLGLIYLTQAFTFSETYKNNRINVIKRTSLNIKNNINNSNLENYLNNLDTDNGDCIRVTIPSNSFDMTVHNSCPLSNFDESTIKQMAIDIKDNGGDKLFDDYKSLNSERDDLYVYGVLAKYKDADALILVSGMVAPIDATLKTIQNQFYIISAIIIVLTVVLALMISKMIVKPIKEINNEAVNLSKGSYNGKSIHSNSKEADELNRTLEKANTDINKAEQAKKELLSNVSHDLRTPITMIMGYAEMIKEMPNDETEKNAEIIIDEASHLSTLVDDLMDISNSETKQLSFNINDVSVNKLLSSVYSQYKAFCELQNIDIKLKLLEDKIVKTDENRITQVLYNFINNAINYNDKTEKYIELGVENIDGHYRVYVMDNGNGIPQNEINNIWDRYYKIDKVHKRQHLGSGIGLALSKSILEALGYKYGVESEYTAYSKFYFDIG